jgi:murein tripeptide amidase MpaA
MSASQKRYVVCVAKWCHGSTVVARKNAPAVGFLGGVHGMERIGSQVVLAFLHTLVERLRWGDSLAQLLEWMRLVFMPLVNAAGLRFSTRSNPNGVDLMRNASVDADSRTPFLLEA